MPPSLSLLLLPALPCSEGAGNERKQIYICGAREKRQITATPCTFRSGKMVLMQIIFGGLTTMCHPRSPPLLIPTCTSSMRPRNVRPGLPPPSDLTSRTPPTIRETMGRFLDELLPRLGRIKRECGLAPEHPAILVADNAPSHTGTALFLRARSISHIFMSALTIPPSTCGPPSLRGLRFRTQVCPILFPPPFAALPR